MRWDKLLKLVPVRAGWTEQGLIQHRIELLRLLAADQMGTYYHAVANVSTVEVKDDITM